MPFYFYFIYLLFIDYYFLVLCPSHLVHQWVEEINNRTDGRINIYIILLLIISIYYYRYHLFIIYYLILNRLHSDDYN
jgi:hypothetical protein